LIKYILFDASYTTLFAITLGYFLFLYFVVGYLFLFTCKKLEGLNILNKIIAQKVPKSQTVFEIKHSLKSIVIFGFSILPIIFLVRLEKINFLPDTLWNLITGLILLNIWNEIHFYVVHRIMHQKFMMKKVHYIHHKSLVPTVFSVYSFHWLEALLLSTVPLSIVPFIPFSFTAIALYPMSSILLNFAGHCNYRFGKGKGESWRLFGTHHNEHHSKGRQNYGFAINFLDKLFSYKNLKKWKKSI